MAAQLGRAGASLIGIARRSHGFSSLVTRSTASSSSVFRLRRFLPFSTCSPLQTQLPKGKEEPQSSNRLAIQVKEITNDDCSKTSLKMVIKLVYGYRFDKEVVFDIALPNGQGEVAIQNATMSSVDDYLMEYIQELMDKFKGLLHKGGFNCKLDSVLKLAKELKQFKKRVVPKAESEHSEQPPKNWSLNLMLDTKDEIIEIRVPNKNNDKGLWMHIDYMCRNDLNRNMEFDVELLDGQGQIAIRDVKL